MGAKVVGNAGTQSYTASTDVTFDSAKLSQKLGGTSPDSSKSYTYTIVDHNGNTQSFSLTQDKTYQDLLTKLSSYGAASGNTVTLSNTESFYMISMVTLARPDLSSFSKASTFSTSSRWAFLWAGASG